MSEWKSTSERLGELGVGIRGERLGAQQRERQAAAAADWERRREEGRRWAYFRAGVPVPPEDDALARAKRLLAAKDPWDSIPIAKRDLAELVERAERVTP